MVKTKIEPNWCSDAYLISTPEIKVIIPKKTWSKIAKSNNIKVHERKINPSELSDFVGCFLTGTAAEVTPVSCIAENQFKVCKTIIDLNENYQALVRKKKAT